MEDKEPVTTKRILLSIKPEYVERIAKHSKRYEFRKRNFKGKPSEIWIYSSAPVKKIVGIIYVEDILEGTPSELWTECKQYAGIKEKPYFDYFKGRNRGIAIKIKDYKQFDKPIDPYRIKSGFTPPQSYAYLDHLFPEGIDEVID